MALFKFISNILTKREGVRKYQEKLSYFLSENTISDSEKEELSKILHEYNLSTEDVKKIHSAQASFVFNKISTDQRITEDEKQSLSLICDYFGINTRDFDFNQENFNKYYAMALIDKGILPIVNPEAFQVPVMIKANEIVHFGAQADMIKIKKVVEKIFHHGLAGSIRIAKGIRYRWGSINLNVQRREIADIEDNGVFYLTNQRVGFIGRRKQFSLEYSKIIGFELRAEGLYIFKNGKENPHII